MSRGRFSPVFGMADESGMMLVDALIGTLITALFIGVALAGLSLSRTSLDVAKERTRALAGLQALIEAAPAWPHSETGSVNGFAATVRVTEDRYGPQSLCRIDARLTSARTARSYSLHAARWCVAHDAAKDAQSS